MTSNLSKKKTLGSLSPDQLARTLSALDQLDSWGDVYALLKMKPRFKRLVESPRIKFSWALAYELDAKTMIALLVWIVGEQAAFDRIEAAADKEEEFLQMAEEDSVEPVGRVRTGRALMAVGLLMALLKSNECVAQYSVTMNELVERASRGDKEALLRAVSIDPSVLSAPSVAHHLSLAVLRKDRALLRRIKKALDGPHKGRSPYRKLRFSASVLEESGAITKGNKEHVFDVIANQLRLYDQRKGDAFKGLFTQFARWKADAAT